MDANVMKRVIVLKNLQSNMVEEAYVIFKNNIKSHKYEMVDNQNYKSKIKKKNGKDYMVSEAESIINDYINRVEENSFRNESCNLKKKYKKLKLGAIILTIISILNFALYIFK